MSQSIISSQLTHFRKKGIAILIDETDPSMPRGAFVLPASTVTEEKIALLLNEVRGHICVAISQQRASAFALEGMRPSHGPTASSSIFARASVSVEAREGVHSGISAADRATTAKLLADSQPSPRKLVQPGHVFPIVVQAGGSLVRNMLPEGAMDLCLLTGSNDAALFCEILDKSGNYPNANYSRELANKLTLPLIQLNDLVRYRLETETLVKRVAEAEFPCLYSGQSKIVAFRSSIYEGEHIAIVKGDISLKNKPVLTRVQSEHTLNDVFSVLNEAERTYSSKRQIRAALKLIGERGRGAFIYLRKNHSRQLCAEVSGLSSRDQVVMTRAYGIGAQILRDLGIHKVELITQSKKNLQGLSPFGIEISSQISLKENTL